MLPVSSAVNFCEQHFDHTLEVQALTYSSCSSTPVENCCTSSLLLCCGFGFSYSMESYPSLPVVISSDESYSAELITSVLLQ